jgi:fructose/tagatose bisphosphate aldolase
MARVRGQAHARYAAHRSEQAADFVAKTNVDALAIAIGTSHGATSSSRKPTGDILAIERIKEIHARDARIRTW